MTRCPKRLRRSQLSVPGSSEKMLRGGAASNADHVFCDLEDAVAPSAKVEARERIAWALNTLDWGKKTRCVRINDVTTEWCHGDIITVVEKAGANLDTIMLTKPYIAADVVFVDRLLGQLEKRLKLQRRIGIEVLIEEVEAMENVKEIARCSDRLEALIFGMGDYSGSQGIDTREIGGTGGYPGDIFHYARFRITTAARATGLDAAPALDVFSPSTEDVARARKMEAAYKAAEAQGLGAVQVDGVMIDVAVLRLVRNTLNKADLIGM